MGLTRIFKQQIVRVRVYIVAYVMVFVKEIKYFTFGINVNYFYHSRLKEII